MHGAGNDYIYINTMLHKIPNPSETAILWSDRHKGIGSDGLVLIGYSATNGCVGVAIFHVDAANLVTGKSAYLA